MVASSSGETEVVKFSIEKGADVNAYDTEGVGNSVLSYASYNPSGGYIKIIIMIQATKGQSSCENNYFLKTEYSVIKKM